MPVDNTDFLAARQQGIVQKPVQPDDHFLHTQPVHVNLAGSPASFHRPPDGDGTRRLLRPDPAGPLQARHGTVEGYFVRFHNRPLPIAADGPDYPVILQQLDPDTIAWGDSQWLFRSLIHGI